MKTWSISADLTDDELMEVYQYESESEHPGIRSCHENTRREVWDEIKKRGLEKKAGAECKN